MEKVIKLYNYVDGVSDTPFPSKEEQVEIFAFEYNASRMGGAPSINAKVKHRLCLDNLWNDKVYALFNGEKYFIMNTPSSEKNNSEERYEHDVVLLSEREVLNHVYFIDAVVVGGDTNVSNTTKFQFVGKLSQFIARLNASLSYREIGYSAILDEGMDTSDKMISFEDKYIMEALQEAFRTYEIPYYFEGKVIHFGLPKDTIGDILRYGCQDALLGISKNNANYKVYNRISGMGSESNIPYYYPNDSDNRAEIEAQGGTWIAPSPNLMPSIYRESLGKNRFYNAINGTYPTSEGGYYDFRNPYVEGKPLEGVVDFPDIKPTIVGVTNTIGQRIDMFSDFAYDEKDNDDFDKETNEYLHPYFFAKLKKTDGKFGFNLFDHANEKQTMTIFMTSGVCGACNFEIGVGEETNKNIVQVDELGNLKRDKEGNVLRSGEPQEEQNDTSTHEVWIALKKDINTYKAFDIMPNAQKNLKPSINDTFVILGITLPKAYILAAEKRLDESLIKYMWMNNDEKFNFSVKFSRIYFAEHLDVLQQLNENSRILLEYNGNSYPLYIDNFSYKIDGNDALPEIEVNLTDTITIGKNSLQTALDSVKRDILSSMGGGDFLKQGLKYFLRKDIADTARGLIKFLNGAEFGKYEKDKNGVKIDQLGKIITHTLESHGFSKGVLGTGYILRNDEKTNRSYLEVDELFVRVKALFTELEIKKLSYAGGNWIFSPAGATCFDVKEFDTFYRCYFVADNKEKSVKNEFKTYDQVKCQEFNVKVGTSHNVSNRYYWRLCVGVGDDYIDLSKTDYDTSVPNDIPQKGDAMVTLGNRVDVERQNAIIISAYGDGSPSITQHSGIDSYSLKGTEKTRISPEKNKFTGEFIFDSGKTVQEYIDNKTKENKDFIDALDVDIEEIKRQVDKSITTWFYDPVPTLNNLPASEWIDAETRNTHLGDLYYSKEGKAYRFQLEGGVYSWVVITDTDITKALADAKKAQDTADHKRRVFVDIPVTPYDEGDLWVNANFQDLTHNYVDELLRCKNPKGENEYFSIDDWSKATSYTGDENLNKFINGVFKESVDDLKNQVDGKIDTWYQETNPQNSPSWTSNVGHNGDLWYNTSLKELKRYNEASNSWEIISDKDAIAAAEAASKAQDTADHKRTVFVAQPYTPYYVGDLWTDGKDLFRCINQRLEGEYVASDWGKATNYTGDENLQKFIDDTFKNSMDDLNNQLDGKIETYYQSTDPWREWETGTKYKHVGDLWYNTSLKELKRYASATGEDYWELVEDSKAIEAAEKASQAKDTADQKRRVFVSTPYAPYEEGDLWVNATMGAYVNELLRCKDGIKKDENGAFLLADWEKASKYTDDSATEEFKKEVTGHFEATNEKIDGVIESTTTLGNRVTSTENRLTVNEKAIKLKASQTALDTLSSKVATNTSAISVNSKAIKLKASQTDVDTLTGRVADNESAITVNSTAISSKVSSKDFNGNNIVSKINQTSTTIDIDASKINLTGAVTFSSFNSSLQTDFNGKADSSSLGSLASQSTVYWSDLSGNTQNTINNKASKSDLEGKANTADLGALAYLSSIGLTDIDADTQGKISGAMQEKTYISGGFIKTEYIDVDNLVATNISATKGNIGAFTITTRGLVSDNWANIAPKIMISKHIASDYSYFNLDPDDRLNLLSIEKDGATALKVKSNYQALNVDGDSNFSGDVNITGKLTINNKTGITAVFRAKGVYNGKHERDCILYFENGILTKMEWLL